MSTFQGFDGGCLIWFSIVTTSLRYFDPMKGIIYEDSPIGAGIRDGNAAKVSCAVVKSWCYFVYS